VCVLCSLLPSSLYTDCDRTEQMGGLDRVGVSDCVVVMKGI
jgi:hypothetical protein